MDWHGNELYRSPDEGMVAGVCLGLSRYFDVDVALVRAIFIGLLVFSGASLMVYIALWVLVPRQPTIAPPCAVDGIGEEDDQPATDDLNDLSDLSQNPQ